MAYGNYGETDTDANTDGAVGYKTPELGFRMCIPQTLINNGDDLNTLIEANVPLTIKSIHWLVQSKTKNFGGNSTKVFDIDKMLFTVVDVENSIEYYLVCDIFYDKEANTYIAKALGFYSSLVKILSANFKHSGRLKAECHYDIAQPVVFEIIEDSIKFEKRAHAIYWWLQKKELFGK